jgi:hypothetical protein
LGSLVPKSKCGVNGFLLMVLKYMDLSYILVVICDIDSIKYNTCLVVDVGCLVGLFGFFVIISSSLLKNAYVKHYKRCWIIAWTHGWCIREVWFSRSTHEEFISVLWYFYCWTIHWVWMLLETRIFPLEDFPRVSCVIL